MKRRGARNRVPMMARMNAQTAAHIQGIYDTHTAIASGLEIMGHHVSYSVALDTSKERMRGEDTTHHSAKDPLLSLNDMRVLLQPASVTPT